MNDMSSRPDPVLDELFGSDEWIDDEATDEMSGSRRRLTRNSAWSLRLSDLVARNRPASVFAKSESGEGSPVLFDTAHAIEGKVTHESWSGLREIKPRPRLRSQESPPLAERERDGQVSHAFDLLRTRLVHSLRQNGWSRIAVAAPTSGCGATFTAVNLAMALARVPGSRTILMDMNQHAPGVAAALNLHGIGEMRHFLSGRTPMAEHLVRMGDQLALGMNTQANPNSSDQLHDRRTAEVLGKMQRALRPDVVLYDMPAILTHDDLGAFLPQIDGVLLISDGTRTTARQIAECERVLAGQSPLLGVILNRARASSLRHLSG